LESVPGSESARRPVVRKRETATSDFPAKVLPCNVSSVKVNTAKEQARVKVADTG
jgi:hypothetical protein